VHPPMLGGSRQVGSERCGQQFRDCLSRRSGVLSNLVAERGRHLGLEARSLTLVWSSDARHAQVFPDAAAKRGDPPCYGRVAVHEARRTERGTACRHAVMPSITYGRPVARLGQLEVLVRVVVGNMKGGVGKSTSAVYLACGLARSGRTLLVDADPQGSVLAWSEEAGVTFPATVIAWPVRDLGRRLEQVAGDYEHLVVDTGPAQEQLLRQALAATDHLLVPAAPSLMDVRELGRVLQMVDDLGPAREVAVHILLTKVRAGTSSARDARQGLTDQCLPVLAAQVSLREMYAQSWGTTPAGVGEYDQVLDELTSELAR